MIKFLVVHCSDSPQGRGDDAATVHRWHLERGWSGIGYHSVILETGELQQGRPDYWQGAHVMDFDGDGEGNNNDSLGVCLIGLGGDATESQKAVLRLVLNAWLAKYPEAEVVGHRDLDSRKSCPGFDVKGWFYSRR